MINTEKLKEYEDWYSPQEVKLIRDHFHKQLEEALYFVEHLAHRGKCQGSPQFPCINCQADSYLEKYEK